MFEDQIAITRSGRVFKVLQKNFPDKGSYLIQYVDEDESSVISADTAKLCSGFAFLGAELQFILAHGIHVRLNKLSKV